jgi:hypothetical protein
MVRRIETEYEGRPLKYGIGKNGDLYWYDGVWLGKETDDFVFQHAINLLNEEKCLKRIELIDKILK